MSANVNKLTTIYPEWPRPGTPIQSPFSDNLYIIKECLGEGHFSLAFSCSDSWGNELVAKVLKPNNMPFEVVERKANDEISALAQLRHPNIVYIHDAFRHNNLFYLIVERCDTELSQWILDPKLDGRLWFKTVAKCMLEALHFIHSRQMTHCDIHPGNVLFQTIRGALPQTLSHSITFKLNDLGVARRTGEVCGDGTFLKAIRPPECINQHAYGEPSYQVDLYQTGLVLLQLLLGSLVVFTDEQKIEGAPRELAKRELPEPYYSAVEAMLRRHVQARPISALAAWKEINRLLT